MNPFVNLSGNPANDNRLLSLFARWLLPAAEFEVYAEWAREDALGGLEDLLREPNHSQAYVLGFQKLGHWSSARLRWWRELAHLEHSSSVRSGRGAVTFCTHTVLRQGCTNRGQLLGAWIGPGSDSQILGVDRIAGARMTGLASACGSTLTPATTSGHSSTHTTVTTCRSRCGCVTRSQLPMSCTYRRWDPSPGGRTQLRPFHG